jgi:hypothetical protein
MPPEQECPHCDAWAVVPSWSEDPADMFRVICPSCGRSSDISEVGYRLRIDGPSDDDPDAR